MTDQPVSPAPPTGRAAQWRAAADVVEAMNEGCGQRKPCASCDAREDAADALRDTARRLAAEPEPGARHVHITIRHPDPTTANTAALCIADLIRGEYGDSLNLAITTDAQDTGAGPSRPADETPDGGPAAGARQSDDPDRIVAYRSRGGRLLRCLAHHPGREAIGSGDFRPVTADELPDGGICTYPTSAGSLSLRCGVDVLIPQPAAGARQDGAQPADPLCVCGHTKTQHPKISGRLLCDECDPDSTDNLTCKEFDAL